MPTMQRLTVAGLPDPIALSTVSQLLGEGERVFVEKLSSTSGELHLLMSAEPERLHRLCQGLEAAGATFHLSSADESREELDATDVQRVVLLAVDFSLDAISSIFATLQRHSGEVIRLRSLSKDAVAALELQVLARDWPNLRRELTAVAEARGLDISITKHEHSQRGPHLVVMDVDSTVIQDEVVELLANRAGVGEEVKRITDAAMRGELDFEQSLRRRVALLRGLPESVFAEVFAEVRFTPGANELVRALKALGYKVALVSGGFSQVVVDIAAKLGVDYWRANLLEVVDGEITGEILGEVVDRAAKAQFLREFAADSGIALSHTIAVGDGANDLDMIEVAELGVAFNAKPKVRAAADAAITVPRLDSLLYLLGLDNEEIADLLKGR